MEENINNQHQIYLENVTVKIGDRDIIKNVSFSVPCGKIIALIGPNGAGKSTVLKAILGQIPYIGRINFCNDACHGGKGKMRIGYVPQKLHLDVSSPLTVDEFFSISISKIPCWLPSSQKHNDRVFKSLSMVNASHLQFSRLSALSGGEIQRVLLALALDPIPHILLLDEPVASVDVIGVETFYDLIKKLSREYGITVFMVSHDLSVVSKVADKIICINQTIKCEGSSDDIVVSQAIEETFGKGMGVYHHHD